MTQPFNFGVFNGMGGMPSPGLSFAPVAPAPPAAGDFLSQVGQAAGYAPAAGPPAQPPPSPAPPPAPPPPVAAGPTPGASAPTAPLGPMVPPQTEPDRFKLVGHGGVIPAHEVERRGPSLLRDEQQAVSMTDNAIKHIQERNQAAANYEYDMAQQQAAAAAGREDGAAQAAAAREQELQARQQDFDRTVQQLGQMRMDPDRFWASQSTPQKISRMLGIALGGFVAGARGGSNIGLDIVNQEIDRDIKAQEFAYNAMKDSASAKQTAFGMAMQKFQNADAARAAARAAALDTAAAQAAQVAAVNKGTEVGNRAEDARVQLQNQIMNMTQQGIAFMPAQNMGPQIFDRHTGMVLSRSEYLAQVAKEDENEEKRQAKATDVAGQVLVEGVKGQNELARDQAKAIKEGKQYQVRLPTGEVVNAQGPKQQEELIERVTNAKEVQRLVNEAKELRSDPSWRVSHERRQRMDAIQTDLLALYKRQNKIRAMNDSALDMATKAVGDLSNIGSGPETVLDRLNNQAQRSLSEYTATIPGASSQAQGSMPASTQYHGGEEE